MSLLFSRRLFNNVHTRGMKTFDPFSKYFNADVFARSRSTSKYSFRGVLISFCISFVSAELLFLLSLILSSLFLVRIILSYLYYTVLKFRLTRNRTSSSLRRTYPRFYFYALTFYFRFPRLFLLSRNNPSRFFFFLFKRIRTPRYNGDVYYYH